MASSVIVTGGAGYVGSHVCRVLAAHGWTVTAYDSLLAGHRDLVKWGPLVVGDIRDGDRLADAMRAAGATAVVHCAALTSVPESVAKPELYQSVNVDGARAVIEAARLAGVSSFVFSGTCAVYGDAGDAPLTEDLPCRPTTPYGRTKREVEILLEETEARGDLRAISLRYFNAAGAEPGDGIGERHDPETHLIPLTIRAALDPDAVLTVYGSDYDTPDGTAIRDYVHVTDLGEAHAAALARLIGGGTGGAFNLGTGVGRSVRELVDAVARCVGRRPQVRKADRRLGDVARLVAGGVKARNELGWVPTRSDLDRVVADAVAWHRSERAET